MARYTASITSQSKNPTISLPLSHSLPLPPSLSLPHSPSLTLLLCPSLPPSPPPSPLPPSLSPFFPPSLFLPLSLPPSFPPSTHTCWSGWQQSHVGLVSRARHILPQCTCTAGPQDCCRPCADSIVLHSKCNFLT